MRFYKNLYVSEKIEDKKEKILEKLKKEKYPFTMYLLVLIEEGENQLEIFSTSLLYQKMIADHDFLVVGIAQGYRDAICLVEDITREVYEETGDVNIRAYIRKLEEQEL